MSSFMAFPYKLKYNIKWHYSFFFLSFFSLGESGAQVKNVNTIKLKPRFDVKFLRPRRLPAGVQTGCMWTLAIQLRVMSYILMRKAVACELGGSVVEVGCAVDLNRALRIVWGSTSGVGWEEARWPAGRDEEGKPSFFVPLLVPGESLSLLLKIKAQRRPNLTHTRRKVTRFAYLENHSAQVLQFIRIYWGPVWVLYVNALKIDYTGQRSTEEKKLHKNHQNNMKRSQMFLGYLQ